MSFLHSSINNNEHAKTSEFTMKLWTKIDNKLYSITTCDPFLLVEGLAILSDVIHKGIAITYLYDPTSWFIVFTRGPLVVPTDSSHSKCNIPFQELHKF